MGALFGLWRLHFLWCDIWLSKSRLKSLIIQKNEQVSGESTVNKHIAATPGKIHLPDFQYNCHSSTSLHVGWLFETWHYWCCRFWTAWVWIPSWEVSVYAAESMMRIIDQLTLFCFYSPDPKDLEVQWRTKQAFACPVGFGSFWVVLIIESWL